MSQSSNFRKINDVEKEIIFHSLLELSPKILQFIEKFKDMLYISFNKLNTKAKYPQIYFTVNQFQKEIALIGFNKIICSLGLYFGFIKKGEFYISLEGAEFLYNKGILSEINRLYVNKVGEKAILYGNNVLKKMVSNVPSTLKKGEFILIFNEGNEILAIGKSKIEKTRIYELNPKDIIVFNLSDKGKYLREKQ